MPSTAIQRQLEGLSSKTLNYDPAELDLANPPAGWRVDDRFASLPGERTGMPESGGSWEIARRLIRGYEFADPSIVRAYYDETAPLQGRNMLLELRALGLVSVRVGVRVNAVYDEVRDVRGGQARVSGWNYRTLEGHVEMGEMAWEVCKWLHSGEVQFHVHAVSRPAPISNSLIRVGFLLLRGHERRLFLDSTERRMAEFTALGLHGDSARLRQRSGDLTARRLPGDDPVHDRLANNALG